MLNCTTPAKSTADRLRDPQLVADQPWSESQSKALKSAGITAPTAVDVPLEQPC